LAAYAAKWRARLVLGPLREKVKESRRVAACPPLPARRAFIAGRAMRWAVVLFTPASLAALAVSWWWNPLNLVRACSISALIGFGTNWVAVQMLFRPREARPLLGQGLVPAQRAEILGKVAAEVTEKLVNEAKIRQEITDLQLVGRALTSFIEALHTLSADPEFVADTRALTLDLVDRLLADPVLRDRIGRAVEERVLEVAGTSLTRWVAEQARALWFGPLRPTIDRELDRLSESIDRVLVELEGVLGRLPRAIEAHRDTIERHLTRAILGLVRELDLRAMLDRTLAQVSPAELERNFLEFADDKLDYITVLGGILGALGGLFIIEPVGSAIVLGGAALAIAAADALLYAWKKARTTPPDRATRP